MTARTIALLISGLALVAGCGSDSDLDSTDTTVATTESPATTAGADDVTDSVAETTTPSTQADTAPRPYDSFAVADTEAGSNPMLTWDAVDGAVLYRLVVLDATGSPYWAWSGTNTSVSFGAVDEPSAIAPRVFESMTWSVSAHDADGNALAVSEQGVLEP